MCVCVTGVIVYIYYKLGICSLSVIVLHETLLVPVLMFVSEAMLWREKKRSRVRAVQMENLRIAGY